MLLARGKRSQAADEGERARLSRHPRSGSPDWRTRIFYLVWDGFIEAPLSLQGSVLILLRRLSLAGLQAAEVGDEIPNLARGEDAEHGLMKTHQLFFLRSLT